MRMFYIIFLILLYPYPVNAIEKNAVFQNTKKNMNGYLWMPEFDEIKSLKYKVEVFAPPEDVGKGNKQENYDNTNLKMTVAGIVNSYIDKNIDNERRLSTPYYNENMLVSKKERIYTFHRNPFSQFDKINLTMVIKVNGNYLCILEASFSNNLKTHRDMIVKYIYLTKTDGKYYQTLPNNKKESIKLNYLISSYTTSDYRVQ